MTRLDAAVLGLALSLVALPALAAEEAGWSPKACGEQPAKPTLDLNSRASYNKSVDEVNQYETKAKAWNACVQKEAAGDMNAVSVDAKTRMTTISRSASSMQTELWSGFGAYASEFKGAQDKLSKQQ